MQNELLSTHKAAQMSAQELRAFALTVSNERLAAFCNLYASAKDATAIGDKGMAEMYLGKAKKAYAQSCEPESEQLSTVREIQAVVVERKAALDASRGKNVCKLPMSRMGAIWQDSWFRAR